MFSNVAYAQTYSSFSRFKDNIKLFFAKGDNKVKLALEIREKEINSAIDNVKAGNKQEAVKNLEDAKEKLVLVQEQASPEIAEEVKLNVEEIEKKILESKDIDPEFLAYLENHLSEEQKTKLSAELSGKLSDYCSKLAEQDPTLLEKDEKCNPENAPSWLKKDIEKRQKEMQEKLGEEMINQLTTCMNDPRECDCSKIPVVSEQQKCEKGTALAIRCEFQNDMSACDELEKLGPPTVPEGIPGFLKPLFEKTINDLMEKKEAEMFNKFAPPECIEANAKTREECEKVMMEKYGPPPEECMENGNFVGEEECDQRMIASGKIPDECIKNGKPISREECEKIMEQKGMQGIPQECIKEGKPVSPEECKEIMRELGIQPGQPQQIRGGFKGDMKIPQECVGLTFEDCEKMIMEKYMPQECIQANAITPEACEKIMLPKECKEANAFSREDCEAIIMTKNMPQECKEADALNPDDCAKILSKNIVKSSPGSEMEYLERQGMGFDQVPAVCKRGSNFVRSMDCDQALAGMGITLPPPVDISNIPEECIVNGQPVSPQDCQKTLESKLVNENIPSMCKEAGIIEPDECGKFMEEQRKKQGIGLNMPPECTGKSPEECKEIMEAKGIKIGKIEQVERVCKEGEECEPERRQDGKAEQVMQMPKECVDTGVSDPDSCNILMSKINEQREKNGDKMVIDEKGNQEYITNDELNKIAQEAERRAEETKPDLEQVEEIKQEIVEIENNIQQIEQRQEEISSSQEQHQAEQSPSSPESSSESPPPESPPATGEAIIPANYDIVDKFFNFLNNKLF